MSYPIRYPADVAAEFFVREEQSHLSVRKLLRKIHPSAAPQTTPSQAVLTRLIETMLFASMATEEGHLTPVGIVFAESFAPFQAVRSHWELVRFASHQIFDVSQIAKLASACGSLDSLLVVMPQEEDLILTGIATPLSRGLLNRDPLIRVLCLKPGVISVHRDIWEIVRYERGKIPPKHPSLAGRGENCRAQIDSIERTIFGNDAEHLEIDVTDFLLQIVYGMAKQGHGGLLVVLGPEDEPGPLLKEAKTLAEPLRLGEALREMYKAKISAENNETLREFIIDGNFEPPTTQEQDDVAAEEARDRVTRLLGQIARLTTVDGAVVMNHTLDVLAFGAKLPSKKAAPKVFSVTQDRLPGERWPLSQRGTRHRTAADFASQHPLGLALIVSQDGDAACLQQIKSKVVYWPLLG
jgi:hypothetical protein